MVENVTVTDNPIESRYELHRDGELVGRLDYVEDGDSLLLTHTEVREDLRNRGLGERLVADAIADLEEKGRDYKALCRFVVAYLRRRAA